MATELALTLPVLLLLAFASADFGRIFYESEVISTSVRTGAEVGATQSFTDYTREVWERQVKDAVLDELSNLRDFDETQMEYQLRAEHGADGLAVIEVEVGYPFRTVVSWPLLPSEVFLRRRIETRQFR